MPAHMSAPEKARRGGYLALALGVGVLGFALVDEDPRREDVRIDTSVTADGETEPTVLGAVITRGDAPATAPPAAPATFELADAATPTTRSSRATTSTTPVGSTPPPTLGTPWSTERDPGEETTTTAEVTTTTVEVTTTVEPTTTTSTPDEEPASGGTG